jgi:hypothetical protein
MVCDPDVDAVDPDEWERFFSKYGTVAAVSVVLDNNDLLSRFAARRSLRDTLQHCPYVQWWPGLSPLWRQRFNSLGFGRDRIYWMEQYTKNELELQVTPRVLLLKQMAANSSRCPCTVLQLYTNLQDDQGEPLQFHAAKIFVSFETQVDHDHALDVLQQGAIPAALNQATDLDQSDWFRGTNVLSVCEAPEPDGIFFNNVGQSTMEQMAMQRLVMRLLLCFFMYAEYSVVRRVNGYFPEAAGLIISVCNAIVPATLHMVSGLLEVHETVQEQVTSVYNKISLFRYFNTAIIIYLLTDYTQQLGEKQLLKVQMILVLDAVLTPTLYILNLGGMVNRFVLSRFVDSKNKVEILMAGDKIRISDRYSNLAKTFFVALFYMPVLPTGTLLACWACLMSVMADRHGLIYKWKAQPMMKGDEIFEVLTMHLGCSIRT